MSVHWILNGGEEVASARIQGLNIHRQLTKMGYASMIKYKPKNKKNDIDALAYIRLRWFSSFCNADIVVVLKMYGPNIQKLIRFISLKCRVIYVDCDFPVKPGVAKLAHTVVVPSTQLLVEYIKAGIFNSKYIPDSPEIFFPIYSDNTKPPFTCVWFGFANQKRWQVIRNWKQRMEQDASLRNWKLLTITNHAEADMKWSLDAWKVINSCKAVILLGEGGERDIYKSSNRVLQAMALSVPVLAYGNIENKKVIKHGVNGFICETEQDYVAALKNLEEPTFYLNIVEAAHKTAKEYAIDKIIYYWINILGLKNLIE